MISQDIYQQGCKIKLASKVIEMTEILVWPKDTYNLFFVLLKVFFVLFVNCPLVLGMLFYGIHAFDTNGFSFANLADPIMGMTAYGFGIFYIINISINRRKIIELLEDMGDFTIYEIPKGVILLNNRVNLSIEVVIVWLAFSLIFSAAFNLSINCEDNIENDCGLIIIAYYPLINIFQYPYRQIFGLVQACNIVYSLLAVLCPCALFLPIPLYLVNRMDHLKDMIREIPTIPQKDRKRQIKKCVLYHYKIIEFADRLTDLIYVYMLGGVLGTTLMITLVTYQLLQVFKYVYLVHGLVWFIYIFVICVLGEILYQSSIQLADVVYESIPWDGDIETQKELLLIMIRAQKPMAIPGGLSDYCCHELLSNVLKTSYSIIAMLQEVQ